MTTFTAFHRLAVASAATCSLLIPLAAQAAPQDRPHAEPFHAALTTQETLGYNPVACSAPPFLQGTTVGTGTASHMGRVTLQSTDCPTPGLTVFTFTGGKLVLTAANGDTLTADYSGALLPTSATSPVYSLSGSYRLTGGSGRFSGATGAGILLGSSNIVTGQSSYRASGVIRY